MTDMSQDHAQNTRRRAFAAHAIKIIDVAIGLACIVAGIFAIVATPPTVIKAINLDGLVFMWGALLVAGGFLSALGRITGVWILETVGIASAGTGALIYLVVISAALHDHNSVITALCLILISLLGMVRRYIELQIFLSEPGDRGIVHRLQEILTHRVPSPAASRH